MPTDQKRIAVTRDAELDRALRETRRLLERRETRSAAGQVRALALRGARALLLREDPQGELRARLAARGIAVSPAVRDLADLEPPPGEVDPADPTPATDALDWVRGE